MVNYRALVNPPVATPSPYGLLSVAQPQAGADSHWQNGVTWQSLCGNVESTFNPCVTGSPETSGVGVPPEKVGNVERSLRGATPFTVFAEIDCSAVGFYPESTELAQQALTRTESWQVERAFWTGLAGNATVVYPHLAEDTAFEDAEGVTLQTAVESVTGVALDPVEALGRLEQALVNCNAGVGVIHIPVELLPHFTAQYLVYRAGGKYYTYNGNLVAIGGGYTGSDPTGTTPSGSKWIYATGPVFYYRSDIQVFPRESTLDRSVNTVSAIAERTYVIGYDCCLIGANVSLGGIVSGTYNSAT